MQRPLLLTGFMATGKTTVARHLAESLGCSWVDLDQRIEERATKPIARIFREDGEAHFRALERAELLGVLRSWRQQFETAPVISLGGGALLDREQRLQALEAAVVVTLTARPEEILRRVEASGPARPLLLSAGNEAGPRVRELLETRKIAYRETHAQVSTDGRDLGAIAQEVLEHWRRNAVAVAAGEASYVVEIGSDCIGSRLAFLTKPCSGVLLVTDRTVGPLYAPRARQALAELEVSCTQVELVPGEEHKSLQGLQAIYEGAFEAKFDRTSTFVGLGGGVVTDMTGFAAATWMRGVRWVGVPTTLLAMVDASVGGKTAVDFRTAKNSVGAFWQPAGVLCDVATLRTETDRAYLGALAEVVKTALIGDGDLLKLLEEHQEGVVARDADLVREMVERSVRVKAAVVARDEREGGLRAVLNLGHTVGHALEAAGGYTALTHGEAVSLGLVAALRIGRRLGHTPRDVEVRCLDLLKGLGLPHRLEQGALDQAAGLLAHDKKRAGRQLKFVVVRGVGDVGTELLALDEVVAHARSVADVTE